MHVPMGAYLGLATVAILIAEVCAGRHKGIYSRRELGVLGICVASSIALTRPLATWLIAHAFAFALPQYRGIAAGVPFIWATLLSFCITEFAFYWGHRLAHEGQKKPALRWLWKLHRTHHSGRYLNVVTTLRINPFWSLVVPTPWVLGLVTYLGQEQAAAATLGIIYGWNLITHSNFRWDDKLRSSPHVGFIFRQLELWLVSPGIHHTHHGWGNRDGAPYQNFAVTLSVIDRMFGTLRVPTGRPKYYGLPGTQEHWAEAALYPLVQLPQAKPLKADQPAG